MSVDKENNGQLHGDDANDAVTPQQPDSYLPVEEPEPRYDVSGAALGALGHSEEAELYAAAAVDPSVSADLAAMEAVAAELARLAPTVPMNRGRSAGIRSRLVARAAATHAGRPMAKNIGGETDQSQVKSTARPVGSAPAPAAASPTYPASSASPKSSASSTARRPHSSTAAPSGTSPARRVTGSHVVPFEPRSRRGMGRVLGTLAIAAALVIAAFGIYSWRTQARAGNAATAIVAPDSSLEMQVATLRASVAQKDSLIAALTGMHTRVIDLVAFNSADPMGRMFWDQKKQMFIMYASNLKTPPSGKTYQVWLIARGSATPVSAGTFMPDSTGSAVMTAKYPMEPGTLRRIAVTEEPEGGVAAPTGPVVFAGVGK